jgi:hypothetical protein
MTDERHIHVGLGSQGAASPHRCGEPACLLIVDQRVRACHGPATRLRGSQMADAACSRRELFGGAIVGSLPARLVDVSDFRQVCTPPSPNSTGTVRSQAAGVSRSGRASGHRSPRAPTARQDAVMEPPRSPTVQLPGRGRGFTEGIAGRVCFPTWSTPPVWRRITAGSHCRCSSSCRVDSGGSS